MKLFFATFAVALHSPRRIIITNRNMTGKISFILLGIITIILIAATAVEQLCDTSTAMSLLYHSPVTLALWAVTAILAAIYIGKRHTAMSSSAIALHCALLVILIGAATSHFTAREGSLQLVEGDSALTTFTDSDGQQQQLPFAIALQMAEIKYHPGTSSPMDFVSHVSVTANGEVSNHTIAMNKVLNVDGYRLYQTGISPKSSSLTVSYDPWGIGITYGGYALLFASMLLFLFQGKSRFRALLRATAIACLLLAPGFASAATADHVPQTLQRPLARNFGKMYVSWNGRVAPINTLAREFCLKIYGKDSYKGLTADQVLTGWLFYYDDWKDEPIIKVKSSKVKDILGTDERYVSLRSFFRGGEYLLQKPLTAENPDRALWEADEKVALISQVCTGSALKIFPFQNPDGSMQWLSWVDKAPDDISSDSYIIFVSAMELVARDIAHQQFISANDRLMLLRQHQISAAGAENLPSDSCYKAELLYNRFSATSRAAMCALICGILAFVLFAVRLTRGNTIGRYAHMLTCAIYAAAVALLLYMIFIITLRGIAAGHIPLANGHETMMAMALVTLLLGVLLSRRMPILLPSGLIGCGLALLVANMSESNPAVTPLTPVLASPLLSLHVMLVMAGYALFAILALNSIAALIISTSTSSTSSTHATKGNGVEQQLANVSQLLLYPALFLLGAGIFVGAIWANQSWGRYWGWDPKETWALITFIIYALPLHTSTFPILSRPRVTHIYLLLAFLSVLMTYFGVNYLLSGLHSYA